VKRIPDTFKAEGDVIVPRFTVKLGVPVMVPKAAMSAPSPVVVLSQVVKPAGVPFGATAVQFEPASDQVPPVVRPEAAVLVVHHTVAACSGCVTCTKAMSRVMNHPSRKRFRRSVFIGFKGREGFREKGEKERRQKEKACGRGIVTERGTRASKSGLESVGRRGWDGAWGGVVNKIENLASVRQDFRS